MEEGEFGERYYREDFGRPYQPDDFWLAHAAAIADVIVSRIAPKRVLDAGCAMGLLVQALRQRGVDAYGLDLSSYALARLPSDARPHCWQASVTDEIAGRYDLIVCIEVLPHLALAEAERAVANFCRHTDDVLFSVRPYGPAPLHANTAPPEHWAGVFARHEFCRDFEFDATAVTPYAVRYRRALYARDALVSEYERRLLTLRAERDADRARCEYAQATMVNMQRSRVWKARQAWLRVRALMPFRSGG